MAVAMSCTKPLTFYAGVKNVNFSGVETHSQAQFLFKMKKNEQIQKKKKKSLIHGTDVQVGLKATRKGFQIQTLSVV